MIAVGELKEFKSTTMGYQLVFKHFPDGMFLLEQRTGERAKKIFETELPAGSCGQVKLVAGCSSTPRQQPWYQIDALTLMMTSEQWLPLDHVHEI
jgi:Protein of unknown function (DUF1173)